MVPCLVKLCLVTKKNESDQIRLVLLSEIGKPYFKEFSKQEVMIMVDAFIQKYDFVQSVH